MLVDWLIRRAKRTPYIHLPGYMNRWWLVPYKQEPVSWHRPIARLMQCLGISARVHEILRGDVGRHPHDHPFSYLTIILRGHYIENRYNDAGLCVSSKMHGPGTILWRPAGSWHRLDLLEFDDGLPLPVTTLFFTGAKKPNAWGFNVDGEKVPHRTYKAARGLGPRE